VNNTTFLERKEDKKAEPGEKRIIESKAPFGNCLKIVPDKGEGDGKGIKSDSVFL